MRSTQAAMLALALAGCPKASSTSAAAGAAADGTGDWPFWGRDGSRNMVAPGIRAPALEPGELVQGTEQVDRQSTRGVKWVAKLGSQTYGNPTIADGQVLVGTNNALERRPGFVGDYSTVQSFDEATGAFRWQFTIPKLGAGKVNDWEFLGVCSAAQIVDGVAYVITTRGEVAALDMQALADGNQGDQDEAAYMAGPDVIVRHALDPSIDADVLWRYDMPAELAVFPHNVTSSSALVLGDRIFANTSNGVDWSHLDIPSPFSPTLIVLDRETGSLEGEEIAGIGERLMHGNWSSPTYVPPVGDAPAQVVLGAGDGFLYGFDVEPVDDDGLPVLRQRWRVDGNPASYRADASGQPIKYATYDGPSEFIATPVYADGRVYAAIGQDPEHGPGVGRLTAVDPTGSGEVEPVWTFDRIGRTISSVAVHEGVVYAADYEGRFFALDAADGTLLWEHDTGAHIWGSPMVIGDQVWLGNEDGILVIAAAGRRKQIVAEHAFPAPIYTTPVAANGVVYVATMTHLYAIDGRDGPAEPAP